MHDPKWKSSVRRKLLKWFDENQRSLPWRSNKTPYRIWVSEIMLQQTQVATVIDYYNRFIKKFPTVKKLAAAEQADVLKLWEGLGYYRRARQLHAAAQVVVEQHGGVFPTNFDDVLALPGIGRYTAGAILSIAEDQRQPILEGNTIRVFARLMTMKSDPRSSSNQKALWEFSESLLPRKRCGDFNQSLMELGSEICHPKRPKCLVCPIRNDCPTAIKGLQEQIPVAAKKIKYESINEAVVVIRRGGKYLVRKCGPGERWEGLWDFPRFSIDKQSGPQDVESQIKLQTGLYVTVQASKKQIKHAVTRFRITLDCYESQSVGGRLSQKQSVVESEMQWMTAAQIEAAPMSITGRKVAQALVS